MVRAVAPLSWPRNSSDRRRRQQAAVADAQHLDVELRSVDRDQRHPRLARAGQDVVAAGEADLGRAVADVDRVVGRLQQHLADRGRQALAHDEGVGAAVLEAVDADLRALAVTAALLAPDTATRGEIGLAATGSEKVKHTRGAAASASTL